jgi:hypothetical protein
MPRPLRARIAPAFFGLVASAFAIASVCGLPLTYDGSYYYFRTLDGQRAFTPYNRLIDLVQLPMLAASSVTHDTRLLAFLFSAAHMAVPLVSLMVCWWIVRERHPRLFVWPVLGIGLFSLPGEVASIYQSMSATQLAWPILLALLAGYRRTSWLVVGVFGTIVAFCHPVAVVLLAGLACLAVTGRYARPRFGRQYLGLAAVLLALAGLAALRTVMSAELDADHLEDPLLTTLRAATAGNVRVMLVVGAAGALLLAGASALRRRGSAIWATRSEIAGLLALAAAGAVLVPWAADPHALPASQPYRFVVPFTTAFLMVLAVADAWLLGALVDGPAPAPTAPPAESEFGGGRHVRSWLVLSQAALLLAVLATCSLVWRAETDRLEATLDSSASICVGVDTLDWAHGTLLDDWSVTATSIAIQGRTPTRIAAPSCGFDFAPGLPMIQPRPIYTPYDRSWFDLSALAQLAPGPAAYFEVKIVTAYEAGKPHSITVIARDAKGNLATGYRGTVTFTSSDPAAILPPEYTFTFKDRGLHYFMFQATLWTPGAQWLSVTDVSDPAITGRQEDIEVR